MPTDEILGVIFATYCFLVPIVLLGNCLIHRIRRGRWHWLVHEIRFWN